MRIQVSQARTDIPTEKIVEYCQRWRVREFSLFGSILRDDFRDDSDVDVLVSFREDAGIGMWDLCSMREELETLFGRRVDLVVKEGLRNPFRRHAILNSREIVYAA
jgi:uncharacterized protein